MGVIWDLSVRDIQAQSFGALVLLFSVARLGTDRSDSVLLLEGPQWQHPVDGLKDDGSHHLRHRLTVTNVVSH